MHKTRSANMQRGLRNLALKAEGPTASEDHLPRPKSSTEDRDKSKRLIAKQELDHFSFGAVQRDQFLASLEPVVRNFAENGFKHPKDVSRLLNKNGLKTACGEAWTPRLAFFLLGFLFDPARRATSRPAPRPVTRFNGKPTKAIEARAPAPLTREELTRRLSAIGRVKDSTQ
jgi:hypothetical protein